MVAAEATSAIALPPALQAAAAAVLSGTVTLVTAGSSEEVHSAAAGTEGGAEARHRVSASAPRGTDSAWQEDEEKLEAADEDSERFRKLKEVAQSVKVRARRFDAAGAPCFHHLTRTCCCRG